MAQSDWLIEHFGAQKAGFDPSEAGGTGRKESWRRMRKKNPLKYVKKRKKLFKERNVNQNPWGTGSDADALKQQFEERFQQNTKAANIEFHQLLRKKEGYGYYAQDDQGNIEQEAYQRGSSDADEIGYRDKTTRVKGQALNAVEAYKLWRYETRFVATEEQIGSGNQDYNPYDPMLDKTAPGTGFEQQQAGVTAKKVGRQERGSGKSKLRKERATKGVQL